MSVYLDPLKMESVIETPLQLTHQSSLGTHKKLTETSTWPTLHTTGMSHQIFNFL